MIFEWIVKYLELWTTKLWIENAPKKSSIEVLIETLKALR
jgi:hypothetical protein